MIPIETIYAVLLLAVVWVLVRMVHALGVLTNTLKDLIYSRKDGETTWLKED